MSFAVELGHVTKSFGAFTAVDDLSLQIPTNSIYGFIGPNGSGKTTTLRMIMRIYLPDRGTVKVLGDESWRAASDKLRKRPLEDPEAGMTAASQIVPAASKDVKDETGE